MKRPLAVLLVCLLGCASPDAEDDTRSAALERASQPAPESAAGLPEPAALPASKELPDPLVCLDGTRVTNRSQWQAKRKPELKRLFQHYMYGYFPQPQKITASVERQSDSYFNGKATKKEITIRFGPEGTPPIHLLLVTPNSRKPAPVFVGLNFNGNHTLLDDPEVALPTAWMRETKKGVVNNRATDEGRGTDVGVWNIEYVIDHGYGVATFYSGDVDPDKDDPTDGIQPHFAKAGLTRDGDHAWGTLAAWAYGIQRVVDYLHQDKAIDTDRIAVVGHSRNGKTALLAAAFDERIDLVIPSQAGCGGTAPSRGTVGESVKQINDRFPHWFNGTFKAFNEDVHRLPFDQHALIALCAPRPVLLPNAVEDQWANPAGQFEMLQAAEPVYALYGAEGCAAETMPEIGTLVDSALGYWIRPGKHSMTRDDWEVFLKFADKHSPKRE
jgi:hypothetical protein